MSVRSAVGNFTCYCIFVFLSFFLFFFFVFFFFNETTVCVCNFIQRFRRFLHCALILTVYSYFCVFIFRTPSFYTSKSLVNLSGLSISDPAPIQQVRSTLPLQFVVNYFIMMYPPTIAGHEAVCALTLVATPFSLLQLQRSYIFNFLPLLF